jgi:hypothetical protein
MKEKGITVMKTQSVDLNERGFNACDIKWLGLAVGEVGRHADGGWSIQTAAERLGVSHTTVDRWLKQGLGKTTFNRVGKLAELSGIGLNSLAKCMGPPLRPWRDRKGES